MAYIDKSAHDLGHAHSVSSQVIPMDLGLGHMVWNTPIMVCKVNQKCDLGHAHSEVVVCVYVTHLMVVYMMVMVFMLPI